MLDEMISEIHQNLPYSYHKKTCIFYFVQLFFVDIREKIKLHEMKNEKVLHGFSYDKNMAKSVSLEHEVEQDR